jgi:hypothetical protein
VFLSIKVVIVKIGLADYRLAQVITSHLQSCFLERHVEIFVVGDCVVGFDVVEETGYLD